MVSSETPKIRATSLRDIPRSQAASIFIPRSFEYGFMLAVSHADQPPRNPLLIAYSCGNVLFDGGNAPDAAGH